MKLLTLTKIDVPEVLAAAKKLPMTGRLKKRPDNFTYLDISDDFIHQLWPCLKLAQVKKPDYFNQKKGVGAHISVVYPEEKKSVAAELIDQQYSFEIGSVFTSVLEGKQYYLLSITAPALLAIRKEHQLSEKLCIKNHLVDLHMTFGIIQI